MSLPAPTITIWFGLDYDTGLFFTLDDPVKGLLDGATYTLAGDIGTQVQTDAYDVSIRRGRSRELDEIEAGTCEIRFRNFDRFYDPLSGSAVASQVTPGRRITVEICDQVVFDGTTEDWNVTYSNDGDAVAEVVATDALGVLARKEFDEWTATAGQTVGPRLSAAVNRPEIGFGFGRDFGTGVSTLQGDLISWGSNALNYLQLVVKSELGLLFASRENVLTFRDRHATVTSPVTLNFGDGGVEFSLFELVVGADLLFNRVGVDREGGTLQTVGDATSQGQFGVRALNLGGMLMDSDSQARSMAEFLLYRYKDPSQQVSSITVNVSVLDPEDAAAVCRLEIGDLISMTVTPMGIGDEIAQTLMVEGIDHQFSFGDQHFVKLDTAPLLQFGAFILDDPVLGALDTGGFLTF